MSIGRQHPILEHIEDAESWLARAKTSYRAANEIRGELDLSLAQAELRYAWELSRGRTEGRAAAPHSGRRPAAVRRWLPLAAALGLFLALALAVRLWQRPLPREVPPLAAEAPPETPAKAMVGMGAGSPGTFAPAAPASGGTGAAERKGRPVRANAPVGIPADAAPAAAPQPAAALEGTREESKESREEPSSPATGSPPAAFPVQPAPAPAREEIPPSLDAKPAAQPGFELGELERVAKETLISGMGAIDRNN